MEIQHVEPESWRWMVIFDDFPDFTWVIFRWTWTIIFQGVCCTTISLISQLAHPRIRFIFPQEKCNLETCLNLKKTSSNTFNALSTMVYISYIYIWWPIQYNCLWPEWVRCWWHNQQDSYTNNKINMVGKKHIWKKPAVSISLQLKSVFFMIEKTWKIK